LTLERDEFDAKLSLLTGQECWSVIAGSGTGSTIHLAFGRRIPRRVPVNNSILSEAERIYEGEFDLFVECAWRLERSNVVLCGSTDDDRNDGPMVIGLQQVVGGVVASVEVSKPIPDLILRFTGDLCLRVFCDQTNPDTNYDNYSFRMGDTILAVKARGRLAVSTSSSE
jgi:hypothetical protein